MTGKDAELHPPGGPAGSAGAAAPLEAARRRTPARRRALRWTAAALLLIGIGLAALAFLALATEPGARWVLTRLAAAVPGELAVDHLEGPLRGPLTVHGLRYTTDAMELTVERVSLEWHLRELLFERIDITRLEVDGVEVATVPGPEDREPSPLPDVDLPFDVIVRNFRLRRLVIRTAAPSADRPARSDPSPPTEPFVVDSIDLATAARGGTVEVDHLSVRSADLELDASGTLRPQGAYEIDLDLGWAFRSEGRPELSGGGTLTGTLEELAVRQELAEPFSGRVDALLLHPLLDPVFEATIEVESVAPRIFDPDWPELTADARLEAAGTVEKLEVEGTVDVDSAGYGRLSARLDMALEGRELAVREMVVTRPGTAARIEARGDLTLPAPASAPAADAPEPLRFALALTWNDLAWPLVGAPTVSSRRGEADVEGTVDDYRLAVTAAVAADPLATLGPLGTLSATGRGDSRSFDLVSFGGDLLSGRLTGSGRVRWDPRLEWSLELAGRGIDPSTLAAEYPGSLDFRASTTGHLEEAGPVGRVALAELSGTLRGEPVEARGTVELSGDVYRLGPVAPLEVTWAQNRLAASGTLGGQYDLTLHLETPDLGVAFPGATGFLTVDATVVGPSEAPRIALTGRGVSLGHGSSRVAGLDLSTDLDLAVDGPIDIELTATGVEADGVTVDRLTLAADGRRGAHTLVLDLDPVEGGPAAVRLVLEGGLDEVAEGETPATWRGHIARLDVDANRAAALGAVRGAESPQLGTWSLERPADLVASAEAVTLADFCWVGRGRICAEGTWQAEGGWSADATLAGVPLALAASFLPQGLEVDGDLDGRLEVGADVAGRVRGTLGLVPGPGELVSVGTGEAGQRLRYRDGAITAVAGPDGVIADLGLVLVDLGQVEGHLELPGYEVSSNRPEAQVQPVRGHLTASLADLSFVEALVDGVSEVAGRVDADLTVGGTLAAPEVRGQAVLSEGRVDLPEYGLELRDLQISAHGVGREPVAIAGTVRSGEGRLTLEGSVPLAPSAEAAATLRVRGDGVEVMNTKEIRAVASPDLALTWDGALAEVAGEIRVPRAKIEIKKRAPGAVEASDDVVFVGPDATERRDQELPVAARVRMILGADVEIDVLGLHAEPTGSLLLVEQLGRPTSATGELRLEKGTYNAYGQDLAIERGRLVFAGPLTDPGIDLRASRQADDGVVAGLQVTGTLSRTEVTLWSEPPMPESEQLSYLLLGRPLGRPSEAEGSLLANAASSLGIMGANLLAERFGARLGLEEVRFETDGGLDQASLVLGKYLSPRLFVGYGIGLFEAVSTFRIRYLLTDQLTLEAQSGKGTSADLLYTLERGKGEKRRAPGGSEDAFAEQPQPPTEGDPDPMPR